MIKNQDCENEIHFKSHIPQNCFILYLFLLCKQTIELWADERRDADDLAKPKETKFDLLKNNYLTVNTRNGHSTHHNIKDISVVN